MLFNASTIACSNKANALNFSKLSGYQQIWRLYVNNYLIINYVL